MAILGETKPVSKLIIEMGGDEYVFSGGGGVEPGVPLPDDTVGSNAIIDGAVQMQDLHEDLKEKIQKTYDEDDEALYMDFEEADVNNSAGSDTNAEDGSDDI